MTGAVASFKAMEARKQLREWRKSKGLTQFGASLVLGVTKDFVGMLERGERKPGLSLANLIKRQADIPTEDWDELFNVIARGFFLCCREAAKIMIEKQNSPVIWL